LRGDGGGFGVTLERVIRKAARRRKGEEMRVCKQSDSTEKKETEEQGGLAERGLETLRAEKSEAKKNIPQRMLQTVNG